MTTPVQLTPTDRLNDVERLLRNLVNTYYEGACIYRQLPANDNALRVFWRIRLGVLAHIGSDLADALGVAEPDWEALNDLNTADPTPTRASDREPTRNPKRGQP